MKGTCHRGHKRAAGLAFARAWREENRARFDEMDRQGLFSDSWARCPIGVSAPEWPLSPQRINLERSR
jgi:hypothetical protein